MIIGLATPRVAASLEDGLETAGRLIAEASRQGAEIVCFPEAYLPGLRGTDIDVLPFGPSEQARVRDAAAELARLHGVALILGTEQPAENGLQNVALVLDAQGRVLGHQSKTQVAPEEDPYYVPGDMRQLFEVNGVKLGIAICHEGWRYPETVRWAAVRGAKVVFHPHQTGSDRAGTRLTRWGSPDAPYYEKAMMCRALENTIYFASVNYAMRYQESATSVIDPTGKCSAFLPYGQEGVLVQSIDVGQATGALARRYAPERYPA